MTSSTSSSASSTPQTQTPAERNATEQRLERDWNGLLLNDYFNCDGRAVQDLFAAERREIEHPSRPATPSRIETPRHALENKIETTNNGLLWLDYMNCDSCGAMDLWAEERRQLEEVDKSSK